MHDVTRIGGFLASLQPTQRGVNVNTTACCFLHNLLTDSYTCIHKLSLRSRTHTRGGACGITVPVNRAVVLVLHSDHLVDDLYSSHWQSVSKDPEQSKRH
jgi:hypothetical protein